MGHILPMFLESKLVLTHLEKCDMPECYIVSSIDGLFDFLSQIITSEARDIVSLAYTNHILITQ